ncbi:molybdopterin-dependent oxidoreductase [soil metagenome]
MTTRRANLWAALVGVIAALATLATAELVALMVAPSSSPLLAVGSFVIDLVPPWVKDAAIALFGTADKLVLLISLGVLVAALAVGVGILEFRRPPWGVVGLAAVGLVAAIAAGTRAGATILWTLPAAIGVVAGAIVLRIATDKLRGWLYAIDRDAGRQTLSRRGFLIALGGTAAGALVVGLGARVLGAGVTAVEAVREALTLPKPATPAPPIPAGASLDVPGISPLISANDTFYRIDTALQVPVIEADKWRLRVNGLVENEVEMDFAELLALPLTEHAVTLMCVSNEVGGNLVGNAVWLGYPIREVLKRAKPQPGADMVLSRSIDGFTASSPLEVLMDPERESLLAVGMNGAPLPIEHGFPVRMVVPGLYGYVSATKWVVELKVTRFADDRAYWTDRGWDAKGPVKTASRIDVPTNGARVGAGTVAIAGVAWAQHRGIEGVQVRVDDGAWKDARLATAISSDTWVQWVYEWQATSGSHTVQVRATDALGDTQSGNRVPPAPNGSEGWHTITVTVD